MGDNGIQKGQRPSSGAGAKEAGMTSPPQEQREVCWLHLFQNSQACLLLNDKAAGETSEVSRSECKSLLATRIFHKDNVTW